MAVCAGSEDLILCGSNSVAAHLFQEGCVTLTLLQLLCACCCSEVKVILRVHGVIAVCSDGSTYLMHAHPDEVEHTFTSAKNLPLLISDHCSSRCTDPWTSHKLPGSTFTLPIRNFGRQPSLLSVAEVRHTITRSVVAGSTNKGREALWKYPSNSGCMTFDADFSRTYNVASN